MANSHRVQLPDGSTVGIRPIEAHDREALRAGFERLSPESRYRRFQAVTPNLNERQLDYLTRVDHHDHEALVAVELDSEEIVGVARFVRLDEDVAECAVAVVDNWQGRGLGRRLLQELSDRAREEGIKRFSALVLAENEAALRLLEQLGNTVQRAAGAQVELDIALGDRRRAQQSLSALLRGAAGGILTPLISTWRLVSDFANRRRVPARLPAPTGAIVAYAPATESSSHALEQAAELARIRQCDLHLVDTYWPIVAEREQVRQKLKSSADALRDQAVKIHTHIRGGDWVDALLDVAAEQRVELIVIDSGASSPALVPLLASPITRICARAPCEVLVSRTPRPKAPIAV